MTDPQVIVNLGTGGSDLNGQNGSTSSADSNDARFLDWPGDNAGNYVYLPGVASNFLSVPDEAALDITGDIDLRVQVAMDDWTPASSMSLLSKSLGTGNQRSFRWLMSNTGVMSLTFSSDGLAGTEQTLTATQAVTTADGEAVWVRVTLDVDDGSGGCDANFYTSVDGSSWSAVGATVSGTTSSIFASSAAVNVGSFNNGANNPLAAKVYRAQILDGIDGTTVLDIDTSVITSGSATSFTDLTGNHTVTINRSTSGRKSVAVVSPVWLFGTDDYIEVSDNALLQMSATQSFTLQVIVRQWTTPANGGAYVAKFTGGGTNPGYLLRANATNLKADARLDDGPNGATRTSATYLAGSLQLFTMVVDRSAQVMRLFNNTNQEEADISIASVGSPDIIGPLRIGETSNGLLNQDFELLGAVLHRRALTNAEVAAISSYYQNKVA